MRMLVDVGAQGETSANPRIDSHGATVLLGSENAGVLPRDPSNPKRRAYVSTHQTIVDDVFGQGNADVTRVAPNNDCFWWSFERALVRNPKLGGLDRNFDVHVYGSSKNSTEVARWKHFVKLYWAAIHAPKMTKTEAQRTLQKTGFAEDPRKVFNYDCKLPADRRSQINVMRAAFVKCFGLGTPDDENHTDESLALPPLADNTRWFKSSTKGMDLWCDEQWAGYIANLLGAPIWILNGGSIRVYRPIFDKYVGVIYDAVSDTARKFSSAVEDLYPDGEPIVLVYHSHHFDVVTNYFHRPDFDAILSACTHISTKGNCSIYAIF